ncbi:aldehyde oxidase 2-like [Grus japonensis]|uniref:Aldehyde oxidase 2-like n=1 Tax=Grus japonensis TaxID=30415 RepID=A0ABC9X458_GRUJA
MKDDFISAFRQAENQKNALSIVNSGMQWNDQMLNEACRLVLEEIFLPPSAVGGKVEYRRTLLVSFIFRFYLEVLHGLHQMYPFRYAELSLEKMSALRMLQSGTPHGVQIYQFSTKTFSISQEFVLFSFKRLRSIDTSEALQVPGVVDVVTARDVPGKNGKDEPAYAEDKVICVGQIICAVVAESLTQAKCGAEKVKIVYEDLEPILTIEDAIKHNSYITEERKIEKGDIEKGFKSADEIIEGELHMGGQEHFYLETNSVLVIPRVEVKEMDVYVSTQHATDVQELVASALNFQSNKIMCHVKHVGGKITKPSLFAVIAAVAANKTGHPVRFALERHMDMLIAGGRHPFFGKYKVGFMNDGRIIAADFQCYINGGCTKDESELVRKINMYKGVNLMSFKEEFNAENLWKCWEECLDKSDYYSQKVKVEEFNMKNYWKKNSNMLD